MLCFQRNRIMGFSEYESVTWHLTNDLLTTEQNWYKWCISPNSVFYTIIVCGGRPQNMNNCIWTFEHLNIEQLLAQREKQPPTAVTSNSATQCTMRHTCQFSISHTQRELLIKMQSLQSGLFSRPFPRLLTKFSWELGHNATHANFQFSHGELMKMHSVAVNTRSSVAFFESPI